jgi:hypothetical protein
MGEDHVCPVADVEPAADLDPLADEGLDLFEQCRGVDHDPVADDAIDARAKDARGQERELVRHAPGDHRVPRIGAALVTYDRIVLVAEEVNDLPLGLIPPL